MKKKKVYLIGAGPGKHDLITVRGANVLAQAEVIIYDYLVDKALLDYAGKNTELICCGKLAHKGRYSYGHPVDQGIIDRIMLKKVNENKKVVRLKNGDPAFFSRFSEELRTLIKAGIEFEVIPGITAAGAASGLFGIPLTGRDYATSCVFVTGHENPSKEKSINDWKVLSKTGTLVIYMGVGNLEKIVRKILDSGKSPETPVAIIKDISLITQRLLRGTLINIVQHAEEAELKPPAVIIVGHVAGMAQDFNWSKNNKRVLFTGLSKERYFLEGNYVHVPMIRIVPIDDYAQFDTHIKNIGDFDWIVFTSRYGVEFFFNRMKNAGFDARNLYNIKIAVIGQSTRNKLSEFGLEADMMPIDESSKGLVEVFKEKGLNGEKIFMPRSNLSDKGLEKALRDLGADVTASVAYSNIMPDDLPDLDLNDFNEIVFTSPSTIRCFKKKYGNIPQGVSVKCIGDVTEAEFGKIFRVQAL